MPLKLSGSLPVIPTPFFKDRIDFDSLSRLFEHLFPELDGYTLCGSTGEAVSLSMEERMELMQFAVKNTPRGKRIVVGLTHTNLREMIALARSADDLGIHAGLVPCPYYFPNSFEMVLEFLRELDRATSLPLVFYDNPLYTKTSFNAGQLLLLIDGCTHMKAVKMTDHALDKITALKQRGDVLVFAGDDVTAYRSLLLGVDGSMIIAPAVFPSAYQETVRLLARGQAGESLRLFSQSVLPFIHLFGPGDEIPVTKALFKSIGIFASDEMRLPLLRCTHERLKQVLLAYEICQSATHVSGCA
ncbi:MAG: dihydrodipicolinate synthase family protein [Bryobacteraceae bacterium]